MVNGLVLQACEGMETLANQDRCQICMTGVVGARSNCGHKACLTCISSCPVGLLDLRANVYTWPEATVLAVCPVCNKADTLWLKVD
jgi:hypothetical protein